MNKKSINTEEPKPKKSGRGKTLTIVTLLLLLCASLGYNVYQSMQADDLKNQNFNLQKKIDAQNKAIEEKDAKISELTQKNNEWNSFASNQSSVIKELQEKIKQQENYLISLRNDILQALQEALGTPDGLEVVIKDGKIHIVIHDNASTKTNGLVFFDKGSDVIKPEGAATMKKIATALVNQNNTKKLSIIVEGHTDNDPLSGKNSKFKDNWDLSASRAANVVRMLVDNGFPPNNVSASGRSEFCPASLGNSEDDKALNRRIEIIIDPNLEKLFNILKE